MRIKYPRTFHLPFSPGLQNDDRVITTLAGLEGHEVVVTMKMDGENSTLYADGYHARSIDSKHHWTRDWLKRYHGQIAHLIPTGWRVCGENLFARHSIAYTDLRSYFYGFSVWDDQNRRLDWDDCLAVFKELGIVPVPVIYRGMFDEAKLREIAVAWDPVNDEGFVVTTAEGFAYDDFGMRTAKWVRSGHVQTDKHWMHSNITQNGMISS